MRKGTVCIYGAGGHAKVVREILTAAGHEVGASFDDHTDRRRPSSLEVLPGIRTVGADRFPKLDAPLVIAVGDNVERAGLASILPDRFVLAVHPSAIVSLSARIGDGTVVHHGAIIQSSTRIGRHVIINSGASVDHDNIIGDFAHIAPLVVLCGDVEVGEGTLVGAGASVIPGIKIGKWCTIGAGTVVIRDVPDYSVLVGNPGRIIRQGFSELDEASITNPSFVSG